MIRHKWENDVCIKCGIKRERMERTQLSHTYSILGKDGCFHDVPVYNINLHYAYSESGIKWSFDRPDCVTQKSFTHPAPFGDKQ